MSMIKKVHKQLKKMLRDFYSQELWRKWVFFLPDHKEKLDYLKKHTEQQEKILTALQSDGRIEVKKWLELRAVLLMHKIHESNEKDSEMFKNRLFELLAMRKDIVEIENYFVQRSIEEEMKKAKTAK